MKSPAQISFLCLLRCRFFGCWFLRYLRLLGRSCFLVGYLGLGDTASLSLLELCGYVNDSRSLQQGQSARLRSCDVRNTYISWCLRCCGLLSSWFGSVGLGLCRGLLRRSLLCCSSFGLGSSFLRSGLRCSWSRSLWFGLLSLLLCGVSKVQSNVE